MWLGAGYNLAVLALAILDYVWLDDSRKCSVSRACEPTLSIGEKNPVWITVAHTGSRPMDVMVKDEPPIDFGISTRFLATRIQPEEIIRMNYKVSPAERGDYEFGNVNARFRTMLGLLSRQEAFPAEINVKVYPDIFQTKRHMLFSRENRLAQLGIRRSRIVGQGREFERLRDYIPDDSPRDIDWKATARRGILTTREYDVERSQNIMVLLDAGRTMASATVEPDGTLGITKLDCAINASVLLAHVAAESNDRIGMYCFAKGPVAFLPAGKGASQSTRLLDALYPLKPRMEETSYYDNFMFVSYKQQKRSLVFLFTDLIDPEASKNLIANIGILSRKHLVVCIALADYELPSIIDGVPGKPADLYNQAVALGIVRERKKALAQLSSQGVITIDATPADLSVAAVNKYLQLKREGRL